MQNGRCKTLDATADGYARGEACITHLLERFEGAQIDAADLKGIFLCGTAVNQDGRSSSLTVSQLTHCITSLLNCQYTAYGGQTEFLLAVQVELYGWTFLETQFLFGISGDLASNIASPRVQSRQFSSLIICLQ